MQISKAPFELKSFFISNLHGLSENIEIKFIDNRLVLVGENGVGKTSILRAFFYFINDDWEKLQAINFERIELLYILDHTEIKLELSHAEIELYHTRQKYLRWGPEGAIEVEVDDNEHNREKLGRIKKELSALTTKVRFLYLPTYRRIEQELDGLLDFQNNKDLDFYYKSERSSRKLMSIMEGRNEVIRFGMKDVESLINNVMKNISQYIANTLQKLTTGHFQDIVNKAYESSVSMLEIGSITDEKIDDVLTRQSNNEVYSKISEQVKVVIDKIKKNETSLDIHEKIICHYFLKLQSFQDTLKEKEVNIISFIQTCNNYLVNKEFKYDPVKYTLQVVDKRDASKIIDLQNLSSGEKQIVSLFSYVYLSDEAQKIFIIIDEPELSLSVQWQKKILEDISLGQSCQGMFAVTHSPFVFASNSVKKYTKSLGTFMETEWIN